MKPSFALTFTDADIALLHRTSRGWMEIGSVAIDDPEMETALACLRDTALGLEQRGMTTKLVIPNSQIRYMTLPAAGPDAASRRAQIRRELDGKTPYDVDDLVFDWWGKGPSVQVAVVARETLAEAEAFATANRLNPLSFVAIPEAGQFGAEPWFGPTALAESLLVPGEKVGRDQDPIQVARRLPRREPPAETAPPPGDDPQGMALDDPAPARSAPAVAAPLQASEAEPPALAEETRITAAADPGPQRDAPLEDAFFEDACFENESPEDAYLEDEPLEDAPHGPVSARDGAGAAQVSTSPPPSLPGLKTVAADVTAESIPGEADGGRPAGSAPWTPRITPALPASATDAIRVVSDPRLGMVGGPQPGRKAVPPPPRAGTKGPAAKAPELSRAGPSGQGRMTSLLSGGARGAKLAVSEADWPQGRVTAAAGTGQPRDDLARISPVVTEPGIPIPRDRKLSVVPKPGTDTGPDTAYKRAMAKPATTPFGKQPVRRGKPRFLGLILTGILLLLLAAVAVWSSFLIASTFGDDEPAFAVAAQDAPAADAIATRPATVTAPGTAAAIADPDLTGRQADTAALADVPAAADEMLADLQDPADLAGDPAPDAKPGMAAAALTGADAAAEAEPPVEPATVAQPATTAADGRNPGAEPQDEILLAMVDPDIPSSDAVALAVPGTATDPLPPSQPAPPLQEMLYQFDADGRIVPTAEGIITPEGVSLVAGPPPRIPPQRPEAPVQPVAEAEEAGDVTPEPAAAAGADAATVVYADPALADARPRLRPAERVPSDGLAPPDDGTALTAAPSGRLSRMKPRARPPEVLVAGDAALQAKTAAVQAAAASLVASAGVGGASPLAVAVSRKPAARPAQADTPDSAAIDAAVSMAAADASLVPDSAMLAPAKPAVPAPEPQPVLAAKPAADDPEAVEIDEPEVASAAPSIPTRASVAKQATYRNSINLSKINLIGVYGTSSNRYAMVRQANGRFVKVGVGDRVDGGRVAAISDRELRYVKNGTTLTLQMPKS
jgi:hypothetical protein